MKPQQAADRRFDLAPVFAYFPALSIRQLADRIGVWPRTIEKWRQDGVDCWTADRIACRLFVSADDLWPDWGECVDVLADAAEPPRLFDEIAGVLT